MIRFRSTDPIYKIKVGCQKSFSLLVSYTELVVCPKGTHTTECSYVPERPASSLKTRLLAYMHSMCDDLSHVHILTVRWVSNKMLTRREVNNENNSITKQFHSHIHSILS